MPRSTKNHTARSETSVKSPGHEASWCTQSLCLVCWISTTPEMWPTASRLLSTSSEGLDKVGVCLWAQPSHTLCVCVLAHPENISQRSSHLQYIKDWVWRSMLYHHILFEGFTVISTVKSDLKEGYWTYILCIHTMYKIYTSRIDLMRGKGKASLTFVYVPRLHWAKQNHLLLHLIHNADVLDQV